MRPRSRLDPLRVDLLLAGWDVRGSRFAPDSKAPFVTLPRVKANLARPDDPTPDDDFRRWLQADLARRCADNPLYSLRAYAQHLQIDHATLSQLLRGKRTLTARTIDDLGARLRLPAATVARFQANAAADATTTPWSDEVQQLAHDAADLIADPFHFAILELTTVAGFRPDSRWIARVLDASVDEVNVALQRLLRLRLLAMREGGEWVDCSGPTIARRDAFPAAVLDRLLTQVRELAARALQKAPKDQRLYSSTTLAVARDRVPEVIDRLDRLRHELTASLERDARRDDVYQLEICFFPLTNRP